MYGEIRQAICDRDVYRGGATNARASIQDRVRERIVSGKVAVRLIGEGAVLVHGDGTIRRLGEGQHGQRLPHGISVIDEHAVGGRDSQRRAGRHGVRVVVRDRRCLTPKIPHDAAGDGCSQAGGQIVTRPCTIAVASLRDVMKIVARQLIKIGQCLSPTVQRAFVIGRPGLVSNGDQSGPGGRGETRAAFPVETADIVHPHPGLIGSARSDTSGVVRALKLPLE